MRQHFRGYNINNVNDLNIIFNFRFYYIFSRSTEVCILLERKKTFYQRKSFEFQIRRKVS